jgi:hypothetical protein
MFFHRSRAFLSSRRLKASGHPERFFGEKNLAKMGYEGYPER